MRCPDCQAGLNPDAIGCICGWSKTRIAVDRNALKQASIATADEEAKEFCISLGLDTQDQKKEWCLQKIKHSKLLRKARMA